jgi:hypothetical protein
MQQGERRQVHLAGLGLVHPSSAAHQVTGRAVDDLGDSRRLPPAGRAPRTARRSAGHRLVHRLGGRAWRRRKRIHCGFSQARNAPHTLAYRYRVARLSLLYRPYHRISRCPTDCGSPWPLFQHARGEPSLSSGRPEHADAINCRPAPRHYGSPFASELPSTRSTDFLRLRRSSRTICQIAFGSTPS